MKTKIPNVETENTRCQKSEIITILILYHLYNYKNFKSYYLECVQVRIKHLFPNTVSYNRFLELREKVFFPMVCLLKNKLLSKCTGKSFVDSTTLKVCDIHRVYIILNSRNMKPKATSLKVMQKIAKVTRFMARMMTSRNITFLFRNFIRDYQEALFVEVPGMRNYRKNFNKYVWQDKRVLFDIINKPKDTQEKIYTLQEKSKQRQLTDKEKEYLETYKLYNEWLEMGGSTGMVHELSSINANLERMRSMIEGNRLQRLLGRQIDNMENTGLRNTANAIVKGKIWNVLANGVSLKYVEQLAEVTENLVRFASYRAFRQEGMNKLESAYQSREATVNFSRWGNFSKTMNMLFPFFSATMNTLYRDARLLVHNPTNFMKRAGMYFALGVIDVVAMSLIGGDDDKNKYKYVSDYMKYRGMYLPVPQSCYPIYALGVLSAQCVTKEKTEKEALVEWLNMLLDMSPESLGTGIKNITKYNKATDKIELNNGEDILYSVAGGLTSGVGNVFFDLARNKNYLGGRIIYSDSGFGKEYHKNTLGKK